MNLIEGYQRLHKKTPIWAPLLLGPLLNACGTFSTQDGPPEHPINIGEIDDIKPKAEPLSKYGNPHSYVVAGKRYYVLKNADNYEKRGTASWYGKKFHGRRTSNGEIYDMYAMTAAHKTLPLPTYVQVTNLHNQRRTIVRVNDRGPFHDDRLIDLSYAAAAKLGIMGSGTASVEVKAISTGPYASKSNDSTLQYTQQEYVHYVQVGAFADRRNAERMLKKISVNTPYSVRISDGGNTNTPYYRVHIGPFENRQQLLDAEAQLSELGINDTLILID